MAVLLLTLTVLQAAADTVELDVGTALERGVAASQSLAVARHRSEAADGRASQATAWGNPTLSVSAENVGQQRAFTGLEGVEGYEGQVVLRGSLPFGLERSGTIRTARADRRVAAESVRAEEFETRLALLAAFGGLIRDQLYVENAREELETVSRLSEALGARAAAGRAAEGDAARAELARGLAATRLARREASVATRSSELTWLLGLEPETRVILDAPRCSAIPTRRTPSPAARATDPPEIRIADARVEAAQGAVDRARGLQRPDIQPEIGLRRTGGNTGLYLAFTAGLPLFDRGARGVDAARSEERLARVQREDLARRWGVARSGTESAYAALDEAGKQFDATWFSHLDQTVRAAEARFDLGEGTLVELLDSRRARLQALDDYYQWLTEWWDLRTELARFGGALPSADLLCIDPYRGAP